METTIGDFFIIRFDQTNGFRQGDKSSTGGGGLGSAGPMVRAAAPVKSVVGGNRKMLSTTVDLPAADGDKQQGNSNNDRVRKMLRNPYSRPKRNEWIEWAPRY